MQAKDCVNVLRDFLRSEDDEFGGICCWDIYGILVARNLMSGKGIFPLMSEAMLVLEEIFVTVGWLVA